jgi:hypothetical protein
MAVTESPRRPLDSAFVQLSKRKTHGSSWLRGGLDRKSRYSKISL